MRASQLGSKLVLRVTELSLLENVVPDDVADEVTHSFNGLLDVAPVLLDLGPDEFHDGVASLLASFQEKPRRHLVD